jgi:tRNA threonylcarbamoyladenosine biosynthesis protein TsaE
MGVVGPVSSPTFVIARVHRSSVPHGVPLVHVDAYRIGDDLDQLDGLDLDTDLMAAAVVVEWGGGVAEALSVDHLLIRLARREADEVREAELVPHGAWARRLIGMCPEGSPA